MYPNYHDPPKTRNWFVQFIESSSLGVRSAIYQLRHPESRLCFILLPMVHVGTKEYYANVGARLSKCDGVLAESVSSKHAHLLMMSYRILSRVKRLELVTQSGLDLKSLTGRIRVADISGTDFEAGWQKLPLRLRLPVYAALPVYVAYLYFFGTKKFLARYMEFNDLPSREEELYWDETLEKLDNLVISRRDQILTKYLKQYYADNKDSATTLGIIYGAHHMRAIAQFLLDGLGFRVTKAEWITVFDL